MCTQVDKMELTTEQRGVVQEQNKHYDEVMRESARHSAIRSIVADGEKGVSQVMYEIRDNYSSGKEFIEAMRKVATRTAIEWQNDNEEPTEEQTNVYEQHPDYPRC